MSKPNKESEVQVKDVSSSTSDHHDESPVQDVDDRVPDQVNIEKRPQPSPVQDAEFIQLDVDDGQVLPQVESTPSTQQVLMNQNEEVVFENTSQSGTQHIHLDEMSPVMHPDRRSTISHNQLVQHANSNNVLYLTTPVTPMRPQGHSIPNVSLDPPNTAAFHLNIGAAGGGGGGGGSNPSSSTSTSSSGMARPDGNQQSRPGSQASRLQLPGRVQNINGRIVRIRDAPVHDSKFVKKRTWDKFSRNDLDPEQKIAFTKAASGFVLSKANKLRVVQLVTEDKDILTNLLNTHDQLRALRNHMHGFDIDGVFTVVAPVNEAGPETQVKACDLLTDYPRLTPSLVAMSIRHYNRWIDETFIAENLNLTFTLIKNNMDEVLFGQCLEECDMCAILSHFLLLVPIYSKTYADHNGELIARVLADR